MRPNNDGTRRLPVCNAPALLCLVVMGLMVGARLLSGSLLAKAAVDWGAAPVMAATYLAAFLLPTLIFYAVYGRRHMAHPPEGFSRTRGTVKLTVAALLLLMGSALFTQSLRCYIFGAPPRQNSFLTGTGYWELLLCYVLLPALLEECLFRGVLFRVYEERCGGLGAVLATSLLFAMIHFSGADFVSYLISGVILGVTVYVTGSLAAAVFLHLVNNFSSLYLENAVLKVTAESKSGVLLLFLLAAFSLLLLFWFLYELEAVCRRRYLAAGTDETASVEESGSYPRLIPRGRTVAELLRSVFFSPFFWGCVLIFIAYIFLHQYIPL